MAELGAGAVYILKKVFTIHTLPLPLATSSTPHLSPSKTLKL